MKHIVLFSGGSGSAIAAKRIVDEFGPDDMVLLFNDTKMEDEDLYRFLDDAAEWIGVPVTTIADGRTPWEVFRDKRFIGNSRIDPCSQVLKRDLTKRWIKENFDEDNITVVIGIDWTEIHRFERFSIRNPKWKCRAPLCEPPYLNKQDMLDQIEAAGIEIPRLYQQSFTRNNCGGGCVKAGMAQWELLLRVNYKRYRWHEEKERELREMLGDHSILSEVKDGVKKPMSLQAFRERLEKQPDLFDKDDWGGCGCAID